MEMKIGVTENGVLAGMRLVAVGKLDLGMGDGHVCG